ncbi:MAG TPA: NAD-dependent epimerase/dehydratase family protein [Bacteroidota bacterium]|nr:NAD-dependent epimerase/dehydratase family protein [Bacteroidota bacterium]
MRSLITGGTGFIGERLLAQLSLSGEPVRVLCRNPQLAPRSAGAQPERFAGDVLDPGSIAHAMEGCDRVYHLAGYAHGWSRTPDTYFTVNVEGTRNVLEAARNAGVRRVVCTSTVMTIGPSNGSPSSESTLRRLPMLTFYEQSKIAEELLALQYAGTGLDVVTVNPTRVFGPGMLNEGNSATRMIKLYIEGLWRIVPGDGDAEGNYAFVEDVARGHILAMEHGRSGERYILGGENVSYNAFFAAVSRAAGRRRILLHVPGPVAIASAYGDEFRARLFRGYPSITPGWAKTFLLNNAYSTRKAETELGYRVTPLQEALEVTIAWLRNRAAEGGRR